MFKAVKTINMKYVNVIMMAENICLNYSSI